MNRKMLITCFFAWFIIRLLYKISDFNPQLVLPAILGYAIDLGIWLLVCTIIYGLLGVLERGKKSR